MFVVLTPSACALKESVAACSPQDKIAAIVAAANNGEISKSEAVLLTDESCIDGIEYASVVLDGIAEDRIAVRNCAGAPGAGKGLVATTLAQADTYAKAGQDFILCVKTTDQSHVACIEGTYCKGVITETGSAATHTTVITSRAGKPAVIGTGQRNFKPCELLTIDGTAGLVVTGEAVFTDADPQNKNLRQIAIWADEIEDRSDLEVRKMRVKVNSYRADEIAQSIKDFANGVGIVQTEYMLSGENLPLIQEILATPVDSDYIDIVEKYCEYPNEENLIQVLDYQRNMVNTLSPALEILFEQQKEEFKKILMASGGLPVSIRLLDAPLKEFAIAPEQAVEMQERLALSNKEFQEFLAFFHEENPIMGFRGTQFGIARPELYRIPVRALLMAAQELKNEGQTVPAIDVMLPLISVKKQIELAQASTDDEAAMLQSSIPFTHSIMIETPAACMLAAEFAKFVDDFSVGTNDLTTLTLASPRDGGVPELAQYFVTLEESVAIMLETAIKDARAVNPNLQVKICGEHAADRRSMVAFQKMGVNVLSVSGQKVRRTIIQSAQVFLERCFEMEAQNAKNLQNLALRAFSL
jgi:pyruvate,orthophosphate dikinase